MKEQDHVVIEHWYESEVLLGVRTQNADWAKVIKWADEQQTNKADQNLPCNQENNYELQRCVTEVLLVCCCAPMDS